MAKRDVELIIRAKNEASRALDAASKSMQQLEDQQQALGGSAKKTDTLLGQLTDEFARLKAVAGNVQAFDKIRDQAEKASQAFERQRSDLQRSQEELDQLARSQANVSRESDRLQGEVTESAAALKTQASALSQTKKELNEYEAAARKAASAAERSEKALAAAQQKYRDNATPVRETKLVDASIQVQQAKQAAREAALAQAQLTSAYREQATAVQRAKEAHAGVTKELARVKSAQTKLASEVKRTEGAVAQQTTSLGKAEDEYAQLGQVVAKAEQTFQQAANAQNAVGQSAQNVGQQLTILKAKIQELQAAQKTANTGAKFLIDPQALRESNVGLRDAMTTIRAATNDASKGAVSMRELGSAVEQVARSGQQLRQLEAAVSKQEGAVSSAKQEWAEAQAEVKRLAMAMRGAAQPSHALAEAFGKAQGRARAAKDAFHQQQSAADALGQGLRQAGLAHTTLADAQARLRSLVNSNASALTRGRAAMIGYGESTGQAAAGSRQAAAGINQVPPAADKATASLRQMALELAGLQDSGRKSLSFLQRFRGQVLSLAASAGGLFAVQDAFRGVAQAQLDLDALNSRFTVAFEGDQQRVTEAMEVSRETADRLGLQFRTLALQYSKLAAASLGTSLEGEKVEQIMISMAEASRVLRLTDDELAGTFKALTDIMSKGTIQAEELKGQLGDRFPGAVQIMAQAIGVTTAELTKMMEQGQLTSDMLADFAKQVGQRVAPGLKDAIESPVASFDRLKNAIFDIQIAVANSGFMEAMADGADALAKALSDPAVQEGFRKLGKSVGWFIDQAARLAPYMNEILITVAALAAFITAKFVGGAILGALIPAVKLTIQAVQVLLPKLALMRTAFAAAGGGAKGLAAILSKPLLRAGLYGVIATQLLQLAVAAYDAYDANRKLQDQLDKNRARDERNTAAREKALRAYADSLAKIRGGENQSAAGLAQTSRELAATLLDASAGADQLVLSLEDLNKLDDEGVNRYQDALIEMIKKVGAARTEAMMRPGDPASADIIREATEAEAKYMAAIERSAEVENIRRIQAERTAPAIEAIAEAAENAEQKADLLRDRLQALAQMNFDNTVLSLEKVRNARVAAMILSGADENRIMQAERQFEEGRLKLVQDYSRRQLDLVGQDESARKAILDRQNLDAEKRAEALFKIEQDASNARKQIVQSEIQTVASARDQALGRYQAAIGRIADLDRRIADLRLQGEFQVADIRRSAMNDYQSYLSRQAELAKLNGRVQEEIARGNLEVAESLAQRQMSLAQSLNQEVKNGEQVVVSKEQAAANAVRGTQRANETLITVLKKRKAEEQAEAEAQKKIYENLTATLERLNTTMAKMSGVEIPLTLDEQKAQASLDDTISRMKAVAFGKKVGVPVTADTREYVAKFDSEVLSKDGSRVRVGVFLEDGAYKIKVNEIQNQTIVATAAVEFSGTELQAAIDRAKKIVEGDFPTMQLAFDSAQTYAEFQAFTETAKRELSASSFTVTAQFEAEDAEVQEVLQRIANTVTPAPVEFNPDTRAADQARANIAQPIIVPVQYVQTGAVPTRANGGVIRVPGFANGGSPGGLISGPGTGTSDSILAAVSNKEYIMRAVSVRKYGQSFMNAVNSGSLNPDRVAGALGGADGGSTQKLDLTLNGRNLGVLSGSRDTVQNLVDALTEMSRQVGA